MVILVYPYSSDSFNLLYELLEFFRAHSHQMFFFRISAAVYVSHKLRKCSDPLYLQPIMFGGKISVDFGVARHMPAVFTEYIFGEQILRVAAGTGTH